MLFVGTSIIHPSTEGVFLLCNILDLLIYSYVDMLGRNDAPGVWYPMYSYTNSLTSNTQAGQTLERMDEVKHRWLPQVILAQNFEETWNSYMEAYNACDPQSYFEDLQKELDQRMNKKNSNFCILNDKN